MEGSFGTGRLNSVGERYVHMQKSRSSRFVPVTGRKRCIEDARVYFLYK